MAKLIFRHSFGGGEGVCSRSLIKAHVWCMIYVYFIVLLRGDIITLESQECGSSLFAITNLTAMPMLASPRPSYKRPCALLFLLPVESYTLYTHVKSYWKYRTSIFPGTIGPSSFMVSSWRRIHSPQSNHKYKTIETDIAWIHKGVIGP